MTKILRNMAASVRQRLLNLAHERREDFGFVLTKYALERVLFRLSQSQHRDAFILKGALLFELWTDQRIRPTRDADFLARGENLPERFGDIFRAICVAKVDDDGLRLDKESVQAERITEDASYQGVRVTFVAYLENARIPVQIDVGFGDSITPAASEEDFPTLLGFAAPRLLVYPKETMVAEKCEAMVKLGIANSRMKDLYDIRSLCGIFELDGAVLSQAILKTFETRKTPIPKVVPLVFTEEFFNDGEKKKQWRAFCNKNRTYVPDVSLETVCGEIARFLVPILKALGAGEPFGQTWLPEGGWR